MWQHFSPFLITEIPSKDAHVYTITRRGILTSYMHYMLETMMEQVSRNKCPENKYGTGTASKTTAKTTDWLQQQYLSTNLSIKPVAYTSMPVGNKTVKWWHLTIDVNHRNTHIFHISQGRIWKMFYLYITYCMKYTFIFCFSKKTGFKF